MSFGVDAWSGHFLGDTNWGNYATTRKVCLISSGCPLHGRMH